MKIKSFILVTLMALLPLVSQAKEILYGTWIDFPVENMLIYRIDPSNGVVSHRVQVTLPGNNPVYDIQGLAVRPSDNTMFTMIRKDRFSQFTNILATINPETGICHEIGTHSSSEVTENLTFRPSNSTLYAGSGGFGDHLSSLFQINQNTGAETFLFQMDSDLFAHAIGWHPNGTLYHSKGGSGGSSEVFKAINIDTHVITTLGTCNDCNAAVSMTYFTPTNELFLVDSYNNPNDANLYTVDIQTGQRTLVANLISQLTNSEFPRNAGIASINQLVISGTVHYCDNNGFVTVPNATVTLTGSTSETTLTDLNGNYMFANLVSGGNYTVTVTKTQLAPASSGINNVDFLGVQRHFLQIQPLTGCHLNAADVNGDSVINNVDCTAINRFYLGFSTGTANVGKYRFTPTIRTYTGINSDQNNQNFDTLVLGDVAAPFVEPTQ